MAELANGGPITTDGPPWLEPGGCDYVIPNIRPAMPQLWEGKRA
jgi:hypothetical protein